MRLLTGTRPTPAENLALDEALLLAVDVDPQAACLRLWEADHYAVIVGRSNEIDREVHVAACATDGVPILRRCSGGGAVVLGPGCLCYSLVFPLTEQDRARGISLVTRGLMDTLRDALGALSPHSASHLAVNGISDLTDDFRKFSGNAQRWRRHALLHHGTLLYDFALDRLPRYLRFPSRQPEYRGDRAHADFVTNLPFSRAVLESRLSAAWSATPSELTAAENTDFAELLATRYSQETWHRQR